MGGSLRDEPFVTPEWGGNNRGDSATAQHTMVLTWSPAVPALTT